MRTYPNVKNYTNKRALLLCEQKHSQIRNFVKSKASILCKSQLQLNKYFVFFPLIATVQEGFCRHSIKMA